MVKNKKIIGRLSRYRDTIAHYAQYGIDSFFSNDLADALGLTAAQVRKDFSTLRLPGKKKVGYPVRATLERIDAILGTQDPRLAILCGVGDLGKAVLSERMLDAANVRIVAAFDEQGTGKAMSVPVYPLDRLPEIVQTHNIRFGIIASSNGLAQRYLDHLVLAGVRGILSLSQSELKAPKRCVVGTVNLAAEMQNILYFAQRQPEKR